MRGERLKYRYDHYTWREMRELVKRQPVVIQPIGSVEDHGYHLPLDGCHGFDSRTDYQHSRLVTDPRRESVEQEA